MTHTLKQIVKGNTARFSYACEGKLYYTIEVEESVYQVELDSTADEWRATYMTPTFPAITLMRWIRKGMENEKFIQIK
jgi:hypothetical protein